MKKLLFLSVLFFGNILFQAQTKQQTVDSMESLFKNSYKLDDFRVVKLALDGNTLVATYSDGEIRKKDIMQAGPLIVAKRSNRFEVKFQPSDLIVFGVLETESDANRLKNSLEYLIRLLKSSDGVASSKIAITSFKNQKLAIIQDIFFNTTRNTVASFLKEKGFGDVKIEKERTSEILIFEAKYLALEIEYLQNGSIANIFCNYSGALNNVFIESELEDDGFKSTTEKVKASDGSVFEMKTWTKSGSKYYYTSSAFEEDKMGVLAFGISE
ncbi:hypothetical protein [Chryseobacterium sp. MP_3.2]|uniref:hypothetical protein n=1 Tax=Chryseobacterium sp. MP_3.2 TaxID=3071712 RepID=UPI002E0885BF|nr:hypothetical protein [Chryseobacterium sp. MP_3.2]